jgi:DNA-directed RNA polymerase subunit RPC12/RpoP
VNRVLVTDPHRKCKVCGKRAGVWEYDHEKRGNKCPHCGAIQR